MDTRRDRWARGKLVELTSQTFEFSPAEIDDIIKAASLLPPSAVLQYFSGFLEDANVFSDEWNTYSSPKLQGIWDQKQPGIDLLSALERQLSIDQETAQSIIDQAMGMDDEPRKTYYLSLMGPGFETERLIVLSKKMTEKRDKDLNSARLKSEVYAFKNSV